MEEGLDPVVRRPAKSAGAFRTISEVAEELDVPQHVLRFWESKFTQVKPLKRGGGRRYYRPEDVVLLRRIRQCLYQDGYTIKGVQRLLREGSLRSGAEPEPVPDEFELLPPPSATRPGRRLPTSERTEKPQGAEALHGIVTELVRELTDLRDMLRRRRG